MVRSNQENRSPVCRIGQTTRIVAIKAGTKKLLIPGRAFNRRLEPGNGRE
jgi:hypothetical protein